MALRGALWYALGRDVWLLACCAAVWGVVSGFGVRCVAPGAPCS